MKRKIRYAGVVSIVLVLMMAFARPVSADTNWGIGVGGIPLTSLVEYDANCGNNFSGCSRLILATTTVTFTSDAGEDGHPNGSYWLFLPGSESNMSTIDHWELSASTTGTSGGVALWLIDTRDEPNGECAIVNTLIGTTYSGSGDSPCGSDYWDVVQVGGGTQDDETITVTLKLVGHTVSTESSEGGDNFGGSGVLLGPYRPVDLADTWTISEEHGSAFAKTSAGIHSINAGTITDITPVSGMFKVTVAPASADSEADYITYYNLQGVNGEVGDTIAAGCVLGLLTGTVTTPTFGEVGVFNIDAPEDVLEDWPDYPDSPTDSPCDAEKYLTENCLNLNPQFADNANHWNSQGNAVLVGGAMSLAGGSYIYQDVTLDPEEAYYITVYATLDSVFDERSADFVASIGTTQATMHISIPSPGTYVKIQSQALSLSDPTFDPATYTFKIAGIGGGGVIQVVPNLVVRFACVSTGDVASAPGSCYWEDQNLQSDSWTHGGGVTYQPPNVGNHGQNKGRYIIPNEDEISKDVSISAFVDASTGYTLTIYALPAMPGGPLISPHGRIHAWIRDPGDESVLVDLGEQDITSLFGLSPLIFDFSLTSGSNVVGELVIENISGEINDDSGWDVIVSDICLAVDGGVWPGYNNTDVPGILIGADCTAPSPPPPPPATIEIADLDDLGLWFMAQIQWLGAWVYFGLSRLHYVVFCIIVGIINNIWAGVLSAIAGIGLFGKWLGMVFTLFAAWAGDGLRYAFNNFRAFIVPIVNQLIGWLLALPFVQSLIDTAGLALIWFNGLFEFVLAILGLFLLALQFLAALINMIPVVFTAFIDGMNATSAVTFPIPDCTNPATPFYDACLPFDVMNFLFAEIIMLPILVAAALFARAWFLGRRAWRNVSEEFTT